MDFIVTALSNHLSIPVFWFAAGIVIGIGVGYRFSPAFCQLKIKRLELEREELERKHRQEEESRRRAELSRQKMYGGILFDEHGNALCPSCRKHLTHVRFKDQCGAFSAYCVSCESDITSAVPSAKMLEIIREKFPERARDFDFMQQ